MLNIKPTFEAHTQKTVHITPSNFTLFYGNASMPVEYLGDNSYKYENFYDIQRIQLWDKAKWNNFGSSAPAEGTVTTLISPISKVILYN